MRSTPVTEFHEEAMATKKPTYLVKLTELAAQALGDLCETRLDEPKIEVSRETLIESVASMASDPDIYPRSMHRYASGPAIETAVDMMLALPEEERYRLFAKTLEHASVTRVLLLTDEELKKPSATEIASSATVPDEIVEAIDTALLKGDAAEAIVAASGKQVDVFGGVTARQAMEGTRPSDRIGTHVEVNSPTALHGIGFMRATSEDSVVRSMFTGEIVARTDPSYGMVPAGDVGAVASSEQAPDYRLIGGGYWFELYLHPPKIRYGIGSPASATTLSPVDDAGLRAFYKLAQGATYLTPGTFRAVTEAEARHAFQLAEKTIPTPFQWAAAAGIVMSKFALHVPGKPARGPVT